MPHQNVTSSRATQQYAATSSGQPNDQAREQNVSVHPEPRSYAASDVMDSTLAPPAAGEVADYMDEGDALGDDKVFCAVAGGVSGAQEARFNAFTERYRQRYGMPVETYAPYAYDAAMVFAAAMQKAQSTDPARFLPALAAIRHEGVTGSIAFDSKGDLRDAAMTLYTYRQGKKVKLQVVRGK